MGLSNTNRLWKTKENWFEDWFDSPAYPLLYGHRNQEEAEQIVGALCTGFFPEPPARVLDLGCGSGRHSLCFANRGYDTLGIDLSDASLTRARKLSVQNLDFLRGDMRDLPALLQNRAPFDAVVQLFTSFGFFQRMEDLHLVLSGVRQVLSPQGIYVLDYLNLPKVIAHLVAFETIDRVDPNGESWSFEIHRRFDGEWIEKDILVHGPHGHVEQHVERVRGLTRTALEAMCRAVGLDPMEAKGNYSLQPWDETSERCIIFARSV
jgi:SAM-dependent methyltransferase